MALHGGEFDIASRLGEGTRVTVRLPLDCEAVRPARKPSDRWRVRVRPRSQPQLASQENCVSAMRSAATARPNDDDFTERGLRMPLVLRLACQSLGAC